MRRQFLTQMAALTAGMAAPKVFAQANYPDKPIRIIVGLAPGGTTDPMIRLIQPKLNDLLGQPVIVENRPGGTTSIAASFIAKSAPDGYNLFFTAANTHVIHTIGMAHITYDPIKDFTPIAAVSRVGYVLAVHQSVPAKTVAEFIAYCKANPGKISYASSGVGNANHLAFERFNMATGIKTVHVPYKVATNAIMDFMAGRIQAYFTTTAILQQGLDGGQFRALAYSAMQSGKPAPGPTFASVGMPEFETIDSLTVLMGPANMPAPVLAKLTNAVKESLAMPDIVSAMEKQGQYPYYMTPQQLGARMSADHIRYQQIIKDANIKMEG